MRPWQLAIGIQPARDARGEGSVFAGKGNFLSGVFQGWVHEQRSASEEEAKGPND